ncbi:sulfotransferase ssu-1-like [Tachypleus tridentatus]|uniref:sulfotransferase ssu-1-like n=1 Tax=Tachypleus tridentatus TaxID=6853 RepID=UPI003FD13907
MRVKHTGLGYNEPILLSNKFQPLASTDEEMMEGRKTNGPKMDVVVVVGGYLTRFGTQKTEMNSKNTKTFKIQDDSKNTYRKIPLHTVEGLPIPTSIFTPENLRSAISYKARPEDVFIVTYPKCGTTWMQYIVWEIINEGAPLPSFDDMNMKYTPFLELTGGEVAETMKPPRLLKVHLPYHLTPHHPDAKYILVARNPFDCCVSFLPSHQEDKELLSFRRWNFR